VCERESEKEKERKRVCLKDRKVAFIFNLKILPASLEKLRREEKLSTL